MRKENVSIRCIVESRRRVRGTLVDALAAEFDVGVEVAPALQKGQVSIVFRLPPRKRLLRWTLTQEAVMGMLPLEY